MACLTYFVFLGLWRGNKHTTVTSHTSDCFEMKLAFLQPFCSNFGFFCGNFWLFAVTFGFSKMFLGTKVELVYCFQRQK